MPEALAGRRAAKDRGQAPAVDAGADDRQERGQERQPVEDRDPHDDGARGAHRGEEGALEEEHRREPYRDGDAGEGDGAAGGGDGGGDRVLAARACGQLVSEAVDDEERVVDRHAEADQGDDVERVLRDVGVTVEEEGPRQPTDDGEDAHPEREAGGHH